MANLYSGLDHGDGINCFRLLSLHPGQPSDPIQCQLTEHPLHEHPSYEALSYCWGSQKNKQPITCNGQIFEVTESLHGALKKLRKPDTVRVLWVDAICINQADLSERLQQVSLMQDIYRQAANVVVWLGLSDKNSDAAFGVCQRLLSNARLVRVMATAGQTGLRQLLIDPNKKQILRQLVSEHEQTQEPDHSAASEGGKEPSHENPSKTDDLERVTSKEVKAIYHLFKKPYWGRCWVIQEFCLARQVTFVCGDKIVDEDTLVAGSMLALSMADDADRAYQVLAADGLVTLFKARSDFQEQNADFDMLKMLWDFKAWLATDPRDKVYALLGLVSQHDRARLGIVPDYTLSVAGCFRRASAALLIHKRNLDSLVTETSTRTLAPSPTGTSPGQSIAEPLPSWACNWGSSETKVYQLPLGSTRSRDENDKSAEFKPFAASGDCSSYSVRMKGSDTLILSGFTVDKLKHVGEALPVPDVMYGSVSSAIPEKGFFRSFKDVVVGFGNYFDNHHRLDRPSSRLRSSVPDRRGSRESPL